VGGVNGGHDISSITFCHLLKHSTWHLHLWLLIGLKPCHFATPFSQTTPYHLCISSIISIHLKDGPSMCPFGTLNQDMFVYIHHNRFPHKVQFLLDDLSFFFKYIPKC
jgi:hypothetical protein